MGPERLGRARTVESIPAVPAPGRPPWAGAAPVRYPPRTAGLALGAAVCLPGAPAGGHGELVFPAVDSAGRSVGAGRRNRPCVTRLGIAPARGRPAWAGLQRRLPCADRIQLVERGADPAAGKQPRHGSRHRGRDPGLAASGRGSVYAPGDSAEPSPRPSASPHDRRTCNRPETGTRLSLSLSRSPLPSNWLFEVSRRGSESRSLAPVPAARKAPASFSCRRARFWRRQRARSVTFCLWTAARIDARVCRGSGFNLRDVFPTGCVEGRAEGAARSPGRGLRRWAELDRPRPQPVVDGVERFDQLVVPWILRID